MSRTGNLTRKTDYAAWEVVLKYCFKSHHKFAVLLPAENWNSYSLSHNRKVNVIRGLLRQIDLRIVLSYNKQQSYKFPL